ncbi:MAG: ATP-binding protein, partial [Desulfobacula sp.]|nr:ATP-binding protein [Desulfobacula sp.]
MGKFSYLSKYIKKQSIGIRVLLLIILCGFFLATAETCVILYQDYTIEIGLIEEQIQQVQDSHLKSITKSTWNLEADEVTLQLEGALQLSAIKYLEVITEKGETLASSGIRPSRKIITRTIPLEYQHFGKVNAIGTLYIIASLEGLYQRLYDRIKIILFTRIFIALIMSGLFLLIFQHLVSRHLSNLAQYTQGLDLNNLGSPLTLNRSSSTDSAPDELEKVVRAINGMQLHIQEDIKEIKHAQDVLRKEKAFTETALNSQRDIFFLFELTTGKAIRWNQAFKDISGYTDEEISKMEAPASYYSPEDLERAAIVIKEVITSGFGVIEIDLICKDGRNVPTEYNVSLIKDDEGEPKYLISIGRDVTNRKQVEKEKNKLEARLRQSQKMESIGTLAGGIAHDFNNILFPIVGYTEMLLEDVPEDSPFKDSLHNIYTSALRAKSLVKQILTFSRQETGELILMKMQPIIKEALKLIRSTIPTTIEIKQDINPDCGVIKADPTQIHQIVMNLATNAYHAMEETGGELKVSLKEMELGPLDLINPDMTPGTYACLIVADTGVGMDKNLTDKIFDPFFTTKAIGKGTGMGLSVVHGIVTAMGGAIQVYSEPGKGTEFHVCLPVEKTLSQEQATTSKVQIQGGTEQILLVDDEEAILSMEKRMLERLGYQVTSRTSSLDALETFRDSPDKFDMVITDMAMPNMSGDKLSV